MGPFIRALSLSAFCFTALLAVPSIAWAQDATAPDDGDAAAKNAADDGAAPDPADKETADALDIDQLRREYLTLRDQLFRSRARAAAVASALYSTRLTIKLDYRSARFHAVNRATVRLDGANVYDDTEGAIGNDRAPRFEGFVAPGRHQLTVRIEAVAKDDARFETTAEHTFSIVAKGGKHVTVHATAKDEGDIASEWKDELEGTYKLHLDVAVRAQDLANDEVKSGRKTPAKGRSRGVRTARK